jgi:hypothetical protein
MNWFVRLVDLLATHPKWFIPLYLLGLAFSFFLMRMIWRSWDATFTCEFCGSNKVILTVRSEYQRTKWKFQPEKTQEIRECSECKRVLASDPTALRKPSTA